MVKGALKFFGVFFLGVAIGGFVLHQAIYGGDPSESAIENSPIELFQLTFLILSMAMTAAAGWLRRDCREGYWLVAGLFACMSIRECDNTFDNLFYHGAWLPFALVVAGVLTVKAALAYRRAASGLAEIAASRNFAMLCAGSSVIFAYSRILGYKKIWLTIYRDVCGEERAVELCRAIKNIAEEGTELFGYSLVLFWAVATFLSALRASKKSGGQLS